jgi:GNAT superfamily N-acetyltransferase
MKDDIIITSIIEKNYTDLCVKAASVFNSEVVRKSHYSWARNPVRNWFDRVFDLHIPLESIDEIIMDLVKNIESGSIPKYITTGSTSMPANIDEYLLKNSFDMFYEQSGMAINLELITELSNSRHKLKVIEDEADLCPWVDAVNEAFGKSHNPEFYLKLLGDDDITFYAGYIDDKIVATTMLFKSSQTAGIHSVGTLKEHRGKRLGTLLTKRAFYDARLKGCRFGVLQASEMGKRVYGKIGFTEYCKVKHWEYKKLSY